jgi:hypothetical protein
MQGERRMGVRRVLDSGRLTTSAVAPVPKKTTPWVGNEELKKKNDRFYRSPPLAIQHLTSKHARQIVHHPTIATIPPITPPTLRTVFTLVESHSNLVFPSRWIIVHTMTVFWPG